MNLCCLGGVWALALDVPPSAQSLTPCSVTPALLAARCRGSGLGWVLLPCLAFAGARRGVGGQGGEGVGLWGMQPVCEAWTQHKHPDVAAPQQVPALSCHQHIPPVGGR